MTLLATLLLLSLLQFSHQLVRIPTTSRGINVQSNKVSSVFGRLDRIYSHTTRRIDDTIPTNTDKQDLFVKSDQSEGQATTSSPYARFCLNNNDDNDGGFEDVLELDYSNVSLQESTDAYIQSPLGSLQQDDAESISSIMAIWSRKKEPLQVEILLKRLVDEQRYLDEHHHVQNNVIDSSLLSAFTATNQHYLYAISAWGRSDFEGGATRAQQIHDTQVGMYKTTKAAHLAPTIENYQALMNAWAHSKDVDVASDMAERLLNEMVGDDSFTYIKPDITICTTLIEIFSRCRGDEAPRKCEMLWNKIEQWGVGHNAYLYAVYQHVWAKSNIPGATAYCCKLLEGMLQQYNATGDAMIKPSCLNFNAVLNSASREINQENADLAYETLCKMEMPVEEGGYDTEPDRLSYALAILSCSRCVQHNGKYADMAFDILERLEDRAKIEEELRRQVSSAAPAMVSIDIEHFNMVLVAYSKSRNPDSPAIVINLIRRMEQYYHNGHEDLWPNMRSWNAVLNTFARAARPGKEMHASQAHDMLNHMFVLYDNGNLDSRPNAYSFAAVLSAYQRLSVANSVEQSESLVRQMEDLYKDGKLDSPPDVYHYTMLCGTLAKSKARDAADRCIQVLNHMIEREREGYKDVRPNTRTYNAVLDCLAKAGRYQDAEQLLNHMIIRSRKGDHACSPDGFSFHSVISAYCAKQHRDHGMLAEAVMDRFLEYQEEQGITDGPDRRSYLRILTYYEKSTERDAPYRADYLLGRMVSLFEAGNKDMAPTTFALTSVINGYSNAKHPDAGEHANRILKLLIHLRDQHGLKTLQLDTLFMNCVLNAWSVCGTSDAGQQAEQHLDNMISLYDNGNRVIRPNAKSYELVLAAWGRSTHIHKPKHALNMLRRMQNDLPRWQTQNRDQDYAYSLVINACAFGQVYTLEQNDEAYSVATTVFEELQSSDRCRHTSKSYGWYIQACGRLISTAALRIERIEYVFGLCCNDGLVDDFVLYGLRCNLTQAQLLSIFRKQENYKDNIDADVDKITLDMLPYKWKWQAKTKSPLKQKRR